MFGARSKNAKKLLDEYMRLRESYPPLASERASEIEKQIEGSLELQRSILLEIVTAVENCKREDHSRRWDLQQLYAQLIRRKLALTEADVVKLVNFAPDHALSAGHTITAAERFVAEFGLPEDLRKTFKSFRQNICKGFWSHQDQRKLLRRLADLLGETEVIEIHLDPEEPWAKRLLDDIDQLADAQRAAMLQLLDHATAAFGSKPSGKWLKRAERLADDLDHELLRRFLTDWIGGFSLPRPEEPQFEYGVGSVWSVAVVNADLMKGLIWLASQFANDDLTRAIASAGISGQKKLPGVGPRSTKVTNAAVWALSQIELPTAIGQLAILRSKIRNKSVQKQIDKAINSVADRLGVRPEEVEEMAVPSYGLTEVGKRTEQFGEFTAELVVTGVTTTEIHWIKSGGKQQKSVPKAVKKNYADELKNLKAAAKDIQKILPAQRERIDLMHLKQKTWPFAVWKERYLNHALVGTLARRLIWTFRMPGESRSVAATWLDDGLVDSSGNSVELDFAKAMVSLWHPIGHNEETIVAWRRFFEDREIKQPFKQAHREVYLLTDAERNTRLYSNRYASHVIKQHQYNALCSLRGWMNKLRLCVDDEYPPTYVNLPEWGLRAEFWVEGVGDNYGVDTNESGVYLYLATDQVRFYAIDAAQLSAHAGGGGYDWGTWRNGAEPEPLPLEQVPPLVLSEVLRDVDLFVGVASVGNDPTWQDGGPEGRHRDYWEEYSFGDLSATALTRREILHRLIPRLEIAERCSFNDKFLVVRGDRRTYKIHLGSSNILMEPNDQYLCIVPGRGAGPGDKVFLPFEGDQRLAVILSKALMLADDTKITDKTIVSQIGGR